MIEKILDVVISNQTVSSNFYLLLTLISSFSLLAIAILVGLWFKYSKNQ